jgi:Bacterial membrane protein YfhO
MSPRGRMPQAELSSNLPPTTNAESAVEPARVVGAVRLPAWAWITLAACAATVPFAPGLTGSRIFYIRDLSLYFWGRYLWLRRTIWSGEWPLWDPYVGAGQSAVADALHQMFLLPVLAIRLIGSEVLGFNLWVALPFPFAAVGTWGFLARRFSPAAATLGAIAYAVSGPVVSTGNFPNMSWSVATIPWVLWAADRVAASPTPRAVAMVALAAGFQALAGEPVTLFATLVLTAAFVFVVGSPDPSLAIAHRVRNAVWAGLGLGIGLLLAAIQLVPMSEAARLAERSTHIVTDLWSLHPRALLETVALHVYGDYFTSASLTRVPWMPILNTGREPFFFSLYFGMPLVTLALFGFIASDMRRWTLFWIAASVSALAGAFGMYTPIYPFLREHLPLLGSFRFPVKYLVVCAMAAAAAAAAGWDAVRARDQASLAGKGTPYRRARFYAAGFALLVGVAAYAVAGACIYFPRPTGLRFLGLATSMNATDPVAAAQFMLQSLPRVATSLMLLSLASAALLFLATSRRAEARVASNALCMLMVGDLLVHAWGINPAFDPAYLAEPQWVSITKSDANTRFYVGGKREGTLDATDIDASRAFLNPPGLIGSASRAALSGQAVFYPSAWHGREMLSYDLAVLWPRPFQVATDRFLQNARAGRDRFLDRTGVRFRVLPERHAGGHTPILPIPYFLESYLYDWGGEHITPRVSVVGEVRVVPDRQQQIEALFQPGWDGRTTAIVDRQPEVAGTAGAPEHPAALLTTDASNRVTVDARVGAEGGYLIMLDSYSPDWQATVDGKPADIARANALFRAIRLAPGHHVVDFAYRPRSFLWGSAITGLASLLVVTLFVAPRLPRRREAN